MFVVVVIVVVVPFTNSFFTLPGPFRSFDVFIVVTFYDRKK